MFISQLKDRRAEIHVQIIGILVMLTYGAKLKYAFEMLKYRTGQNDALAPSATAAVHLDVPGLDTQMIIRSIDETCG